MLKDYLDIHKKIRRALPLDPHPLVPFPSWAIQGYFDAAIFSNSSIAGLEVVIRDSDGQILAVLSQKVLLPHSLATAEEMAASRAVSFAKELRIFRVVFKGNS